MGEEGLTPTPAPGTLGRAGVAALGREQLLCQLSVHRPHAMAAVVGLVCNAEQCLGKTRFLRQLRCDLRVITAPCLEYAMDQPRSAGMGK